MQISDMHKGALMTGARSAGQLYFLQQRLIFVGPQSVMSSSRILLENLLTPGNVYNILVGKPVASKVQGGSNMTGTNCV